MDILFGPIPPPLPAPVRPPVTLTSPTRVDWMQEIYEDIKFLSLRQICLPYSHDSGMSNITFGLNVPGWAMGNATNAMMETQKYDIGGQLRVGARFFDIRPCYAQITGVPEGYYASHGSYGGGIPDPVQGSMFGAQSWVGGLGQSLSSICDQINSFTNSYGELVIVELSHCIVSGSNVNQVEFARGMRQGEYEQLFGYISSRVSKLYVCPDPNADLTRLPMSDFITSGNQGAVIFTLSDDGITIPSQYLGHGFFYGMLSRDPNVMKTAGARRSQLGYGGGYSDNASVNYVVNDQYKKLTWYSFPGENDPPFLLEYTITQETLLGNVIFSIQDGAKSIRPYLTGGFPRIMPDDQYPAMIGVDYFDSDVTALTFTINQNQVRKLGDVMSYEVDAVSYGEVELLDFNINFGKDKSQPYSLVVGSDACNAIVKPYIQGRPEPTTPRVLRVLMRRYHSSDRSYFISIQYSAGPGETLLIDPREMNLKTMYSQIPQTIANQKAAGPLKWVVAEASYGPVDQLAWMASGGDGNWDFVEQMNCAFIVQKALTNWPAGDSSFVVAYEQSMTSRQGTAPGLINGKPNYAFDQQSTDKHTYLYGLRVVLKQWFESNCTSASYTEANTTTYRTITAFEGDTITLGPSCFN